MYLLFHFVVHGNIVILLSAGRLIYGGHRPYQEQLCSVLKGKFLPPWPPEEILNACSEVNTDLIIKSFCFAFCKTHWHQFLIHGSYWGRQIGAI